MEISSSDCNHHLYWIYKVIIDKMMKIDEEKNVGAF
jgi:hypothetical protein